MTLHCHLTPLTKSMTSLSSNTFDKEHDLSLSSNTIDEERDSSLSSFNTIDDERDSVTI